MTDEHTLEERVELIEEFLLAESDSQNPNSDNGTPESFRRLYEDKFGEQ